MSISYWKGPATFPGLYPVEGSWYHFSTISNISVITSPTLSLSSKPKYSFSSLKDGGGWRRDLYFFSPIFFPQPVLSVPNKR